jgi:hypothetical protein
MDMDDREGGMVWDDAGWCEMVRWCKMVWDDGVG